MNPCSGQYTFRGLDTGTSAAVRDRRPAAVRRAGARALLLAFDGARSGMRRQSSELPDRYGLEDFLAMTAGKPDSAAARASISPRSTMASTRSSLSDSGSRARSTDLRSESGRRRISQSSAYSTSKTYRTQFVPSARSSFSTAESLGRPSFSSATTTPSSIAVCARSLPRWAAMSGSRGARSPVRERRRIPDSSIVASTRLPTSAGSKIQSGSEKGSKPSTGSIRDTRRLNGFTTARLMSAPPNRSLPDPA